MPKPPDLEALARRYVELWQDQIAATAADPELTEGLARMMQLVGGGLSAQAVFWQGLWPDLAARAAATMTPAPKAPAPATPDPGPTATRADDDTWARPAEPAAPTQTPGPAAAAGASDERGVDVAQLQARLALLEERLASLEGGAGAARHGARPRARRRRAS